MCYTGILSSAEVKGIPAFWLTALKNTDLFTDMIKVGRLHVSLNGYTHVPSHILTLTSSHTHPHTLTHTHPHTHLRQEQDEPVLEYLTDIKIIYLNDTGMVRYVRSVMCEGV